MSERILMNGREIPIAGELKAEVLERSEGRAVLRCPVEARFKNPMGILQGGMYATFMDMAMAIASNGISTATLQVNLLKPASGGHVVVTGEVVRQGKTITYAEAEVRDEEGNLLARGNQTGMTRPRTPVDEPAAPE